MYQVTVIVDDFSEDSHNCETLEEAMKVLEEWMQKDLKALASESPREDDEVTFQIEKKEVIFSVTY